MPTNIRRFVSGVQNGNMGIKDFGAHRAPLQPVSNALHTDSCGAHFLPSTNGTLTLLQSAVRMLLALGRDRELRIHLSTSAESHGWGVNGTAQGSDFGELGD